MRPVAAGTHNLHQIGPGIDLYRVVPHGGGTAGDFHNRLGLGALGGERREKRRVLGGGGLSTHYLVHHAVGLLIGEVLLIHNFDNRFFNHGFFSSLFLRS